MVRNVGPITVYSGTIHSERPRPRLRVAAGFVEVWLFGRYLGACR